jgi:hypothetical protein
VNNSAETLYRKLVENPKAPQHARIAALKFLSRPSFALLRRIALNPDSPGRLAALASDLFAQKQALKQQQKDAK